MSRDKLAIVLIPVFRKRNRQGRVLDMPSGGSCLDEEMRVWVRSPTCSKGRPCVKAGRRNLENCHSLAEKFTDDRDENRTSIRKVGHQEPELEQRMTP